MAFTTAAFSSTSNMGSETSETRMRCSTGSACHAVTHSCSTSRPSGSSLTPSTSGPTRARWASPVAGSVATFSANAIMTPYILEPVPARDLHDQRGSRVERTALADDLGLAGHGPGRATLREDRRAGVLRRRHQAHRTEDR